MKGKQCRKCGTWKPLSAFHNKASNPDGKNSQCRTCVNAQNRMAMRHVQIENPQKLRDANKRWRLRNRFTVMLCKVHGTVIRNSKAVCPLCLSEWRDTNRPNIRRLQRADYQRHKPQRLAKARAYSLTPRGRDVQRASNQRYSQRNRERENARTLRWHHLQQSKRREHRAAIRFHFFQQVINQPKLKHGNTSKIV